MRFGINPTIQTTGRPTDMAFSTHDIVSDSPTNNFCTLNPLDVSILANGRLLENGNLKATQANAGTLVSIGVSSIDNIYFEFNINRLYSSTWGGNIEVRDNNNQLLLTVSLRPSEIVFLNPDSSVISSTTTSAHSTSSVYAFHLTKDSTGGTVSIYRDGTLQASESLATVRDAALLTPKGNGTNTSDATIISYNFGQDPTFAGNKNTPATVNINGTNVTGPFAPSGTAAGTAGLFYYPPPAGAKALCTANLPVMTPDVADDTPQDYFKCLTYSGTYSQQDIAVGFKPDLVWAKSRTQTYGHMLYDTVRGQAHLNSDTDDEEVSDTQLAFHSTDGFTVSASSGELNDTYGAPNNYIAWCWKSAGSPSATDDGTGVSGSAKLVDTSGAASSTTCKSFKDAAVTAGASNVICPSKMSINQAAGFSILQFSRIRASGQTVPHGLTSAPEFMILKEATTASTPWVVYHKNLSSAAYYLLLHDDIKEGSTNAYFNSTHPNSSVFTLGDASTLDTNVICYLWHSVEGYSKFGSYTGNGSADGTFVYCGFRPAFVMIKNTSSTGSWVIKDTSRDTYNPSGSTLLADTPDDDFGPGNTIIDILSNGWKCRSSSTYINTTNNNYIFMAFAEQPFKFSNAR
jgi:hypothetical protein